jgi:hypothetical protein
MESQIVCPKGSPESGTSIRSLVGIFLFQYLIYNLQFSESVSDSARFPSQASTEVNKSDVMHDTPRHSCAVNADPTVPQTEVRLPASG